MKKKRLWLWIYLLLGMVLAIVIVRLAKGTGRNEEVMVKVARVIDGDTIEVEVEGRKEVVRLIGIDAPESTDPDKPVQCFAREASDKTKEILTNMKVSLVADETQADRDIYGRWLRYVFLADGTNFDQAMVAQGFAREYTFKIPYKFQAEFKLAETKAKEDKLGLWGRCKNS